MTEQQNQPEEQSGQQGDPSGGRPEEQSSPAQEHQSTGAEALPKETATVRENESFDPASKALAEALRISFVILKLVMVCVIGLFIVSGAYQVSQNERGVELLFGKVQGRGLKTIKDPGWHWTWPYIGEVIKVPAPTQRQFLDVDSFWYYMTEKEKVTGQINRFESTLQIIRDGYSLTSTRGLGQDVSQEIVQTNSLTKEEQELSGTDYNLIHTKWRIEYYITDPLKFLEILWDGRGENWAQVEQFLRSALADAVILTCAHRDIDWILWENPNQFANDVEMAMLNKMKGLQVGLTAKLILLDKTTPRQVKAAFDMATAARSDRNLKRKEAQARANEIISEAQAQKKIIIAEAEAYSKKIVNAAAADAAYLKEVLEKIQIKAKDKFPQNTPESQVRRKEAFAQLLTETVDQLYQEALREVIIKTEETIVLPASNKKPTELRIQLSRDATLPPPGTKDKAQKKTKRKGK